jgi:hypothetical protein
MIINYNEWCFDDSKENNDEIGYDRLKINSKHFKFQFLKNECDLKIYSKEYAREYWQDYSGANIIKRRIIKSRLLIKFKYLECLNSSIFSEIIEGDMFNYTDTLNEIVDKCYKKVVIKKLGC